MTKSNRPKAITADVFISYSTEDREKIAPIVQIVRAMKKGLVFQDYLSILPGERWRARIMDALHHAKTVVVFWCEHSAASEYVRLEYEAGIERNKEVIPILLDDTELPEPLRAYQWIDLRRPEPHGGLNDFVYRRYRRSKRHFYPKDEHGEYRDWDREEFSAREFKRHQQWEERQSLRQQDIAAVIARRLGRPGAGTADTE
jgi:hypothetical protein